MAAQLAEKLFVDLCPLTVINIGGGAKPMQDVAHFISHRHTASQMPTVDTIGTAQTHLILIRLALRYGRHPDCQRVGAVVWVDGRIGIGQAFSVAEPGIVHPLRIQILGYTLGIAAPDNLGHGIGQLTQARFAGAQGFFCAFTFADIAHKGQPAPIRQLGDTHLNWHSATIFAQQFPLANLPTAGLV